jgi:RNA polymerase sigma-70 factor (ECF subfamily)
MIPKTTAPRASHHADLAETALIEAALHHEEAAVRELIRRMNPRLFRVARGILENDADAEEAVQETYLKAFTRLQDFRGEARFSTWITRIAVNIALMRRRANRPHAEYDTVSETTPASGAILAFPGYRPDTADAALGRRELREMLERSVAELPPGLRLVFLLHEAEGQSVMAIARDLSLNPITVKTRLFRARRRLRTALEARLKGGFNTVFPFDGARCVNMADRVIDQLRVAGQV